MTKYNPLLLIDFYKACHAEQYPEGLTRMVSYYTPRMSRLSDIDEVTMFGLQGFIREYLIEGFNDNFFNRPEEEVMAEYERIMTYTLGKDACDVEKIRKLHKLGYLPIGIAAIPEGMRTKVGVPQIEIWNSHPDFVWVVNTIETMLSCSMWHTQVAAEVGRRYRKVVDKWVERTCDSTVNPRKMIGDFSMRGQHSVESAIKASAAWLLSFDNTATVPAIMWLENNYNCDCTKETVGFGAISTEHSVMCSNYAVDGDEITQIKRLLTEIYPNHSFSMVSDSYDYWRLVTELLPQCKDEILAHNGTLSIRGDSGNPVEILAGKDIMWYQPYDEEESEQLFNDTGYTSDWLETYCRDNEIEEDIHKYIHFNNKFYSVTICPEYSRERGGYTDNNYYFVEGYSCAWTEIEPNAELLGTVWALDQIVGHTINSKGYKVLNPKLKAIYGDSIIPDYADEVYRRLEAQGYAANNVIMGAGSMSMMALVGRDADTNSLVFAGKCNGTNCGPYTRDTFGIAVKATYAEDKDGNPIMIYKQPKALSWKKSQKGCCEVALDGQSYTDGHTWKGRDDSFNNLLRFVFGNGEFYKEYSLEQVKENMWGEEE
jgi:nicotinic acid phosphoribosyltransferase